LRTVLVLNLKEALAMLSTSTRLLRLLTLLQTRREWAGDELARELEVDVRTLRRDVDRLRQLDYRITSSTGLGGGYRLGSGSSLPPLLLANDEAVAVALGLLTSALGSVGGLEEAALRAFTKLEQLVPPRVRGRIQALQQAAVALAPEGSARVNPETLSTLAGACRDALVLTLDYVAREGAPSTRLVEPHRLVCTGRRWYLVAWDRGRDDWRTFRVDRLSAPRANGARFVPRRLPRAITTLVSDSISSAPYRYQATIRYFASVDTVAQRSSPAAGRVEAETERTCLFHSGSMSLDQLALHVALKGEDFEVLEPLELKQHLATLGARLTRAGKRSQSRRKRPV
jgi:predicted DNA-binding transcriptional regulator YafY